MTTKTNQSISLADAKLYVGTYAKYNAGSLSGAWLTLSDYGSEDEFMAACKELHKDEEDPEFMFQDYDGLPAVLYSESSFPAHYYELLEELNRIDNDDAFFIWCANCGYEPTPENIETFEDAFCGDYESEKDYAESIAEECGYYDAMEKAGINANYFDIDAFTRDLFISDVWRDSETGYVFRNI